MKLQKMRNKEEESPLYMHKPTKISLSLSTPKNPSKRRRCGEDSSVDWYNLEKTKTKAYRCSEFDGCIRKFDSSHGFHPMEHLKHGQKETDFECEIQEREEQLQSSDSVSEKTTNGTKRIRRLNLLENANSLQNSVLNLESKALSPPKIDESSLNRRLAANQTYPTSKERECSETDVRDSESEEVSQPAGVFKRKLMDPTEQLKTGDLVDVDVTVNTSYRAENAPFVCLTSKLTGKAILGHPIEVGVLCEGSDDEGKRFHQLAWRRSRRTPVCYVTNSLSSSVSKNLDGSKPRARENSGLVKEQSFVKLQKNTKQVKQGKAALSRSCVPVELIFSKILAAVGRVHY